jgi:hypothetical protein
MNGINIGVFEFVAEEGMFIMPYQVCAISELLLNP